MNQVISTSFKNEGLTLAKISRFFAIPFQPSRLSTYLSLKRFEEVPIDVLLNDGIEGILLDADGTLGAHHTRIFEVTVLDHVQKCHLNDEIHTFQTTHLPIFGEFY